MFLFKKKDGKTSGDKKYKWDPVASDAKTILRLIEECVSIDAPTCRLITKYNDIIYTIGVSSDLDRKGRFFDVIYYINDKEYKSFQELKRAADIENTPLEELQGTIYIVADEDLDNPRNYKLFKDK